MKILIAWRMLIHERWRSVLAVGGILVAILLMFLQIGLYSSVPRGGLRYYDVITFDLMLTSSTYVSQAQSMTFPRRRLYQALAMPAIKRAIPVYQGSGRWLNPEEGLARDIFVIGYNPDDQVLNVPELYHDRELLRQTDVIFVDGSSRPEFGRLERGRRVEVEQRSEVIGGQYHLGIGFVGIGVAVVSDLNFERIFPGQGGLGNVSLGLLTLAPGADANAVATQLRQLLPADTQVFTRKELTDFEVNYWVNNTSTGIIFGFGVVVAVIVGIVILYQTLSAQIGRQLPQYATLKAMGYTNRQLGGIIVTIATIMSTAGYLPAVLISILIYWIIQEFTPLPIEMSAARMVAVLATTWGMSVMSAVLALRVLRRADPADLF